jgi:hypothetical protein
VWRVEKEDQYATGKYIGPYNSIFFTGHGDERTHPAPQLDKRLDGEGNIGINHEEFCGTATLRELAE